jgi:hypothetical protein
MEPSSRSPRAPSRISHSVLHQLDLYALAASAAGVSLLALAQPSEAKIVYTKTHQVIGTNGVYPLDLNHDGVIDFVIQQYGSGSGFNRLFANGAFGNAVEGSVGKYNFTFASALKKGATVGPGQRFVSSSHAAGEIMAGFSCTESGRCPWSGQWVNVSSRYLGLRFQIDGKIHYGWARLSVQTEGSQITAILTGYAYETIVGKAIRAGQSNGADDESSSLSPPGSALDSAVAAAVEPIAHPTRRQSLGSLAAGAPGVTVWRQP